MNWDVVDYIFVSGGGVLMVIGIIDIVKSFIVPGHRRVGWYERFGWRDPPSEEKN